MIGGENTSIDSVTADVVVPGLTFFNSSSTAPSGGIALKLGTVTLDSASYPFPAQEGRSSALKPDALDATQNDLPANWCWSGDAIVHLPFTGHGSPGAANDLCP